MAPVRRTVLLVAAALLAMPAPAQAADGLAIGFLDGVFAGNVGESAPWLGRAVDSGADILRIEVGWAAAARPADARDPADPAYDFSRADAAVANATARGLRVLASFTGAPPWAEGPGRPATAQQGSWKPDPAALEQYGAALARRYSGAFPDPAQPGRMLPRVDAFQVWNEPNLDKYLSPQWSGGRTFAPAHYRRMLSAFYRGVKSVRPEALVVSAGTAPFGDPFPNGHRIMPARFVRDMLCLRRANGRLRGTGCPNPARFDVLAHHPYSVGFPRRRALNADDVSIPDMAKLTTLLRAAERSGGALPRKRHRLWVTEVSYDSSPPDPQGVPVARHARYLEQAFYLLWRQGVDTITWFQIRDQPPQPSYAASNQSGVYFADGRPKPAQRAFRFPFVAERAGRAALRVWGRAPLAGSLRIERRTASGWRLARTVRVPRHGTFFVRIAARGRTSLRARVDGETSLVWRVGPSA
ncbi:MAG: polysaccharide biosynthesis protein PslG [Solirubrobacteraceae bacterium]|nr:polysaccharide biosynthesis protein PslG [Solirubrobacteraceae bacterium]